MRNIIRDRILIRDGCRCAYCSSMENLEIDHIIPLSRGGREDEDNMQILCRQCNRKKFNSVDFRDFITIGENPEYIRIDRDIPINAWSYKEFKKIFIHMYKENDKIFGIKREYNDPTSMY